jgi:superfamily II DNA helicase RecQ
LDLTEYIHQTGRAGRDGKQARCILFYLAQDFEIIRHIKKINGDVADIIRESVVADIAEVASYARHAAGAVILNWHRRLRLSNACHPTNDAQRLLLVTTASSWG